MAKMSNPLVCNGVNVNQGCMSKNMMPPESGRKNAPNKPIRQWVKSISLNRTPSDNNITGIAQVPNILIGVINKLGTSMEVRLMSKPTSAA